MRMSLNVYHKKAMPKTVPNNFGNVAASTATIQKTQNILPKNIIAFNFQ